MPKVILIQPTQNGSRSGKPLKQNRIFLPGLGLALLAAYAPRHWEVKIIIEVVDDIDFDEECDLVGIGAMGHAVFRAMDIAREFSRRGKKTFMGGYMVTIMPQLVSNCCHSLIIGDGEVSFPELLNDYEKTGDIKPLYDTQLTNLENQPVPRYDLLLRKKIGFMLPVQAGRGCPHTCTFCSIACIYKGKYLVRPVDDVIRDIKHIRNLGFKRFYLIDDNIASNPAYLLELVRKIKPLKMQWASQCTLLIARHDELLKQVAGSGCRFLSLGLESLSQQGINQLNKSWLDTSEMSVLLKKISNQGIAIASEMVVGTDGDTDQSLKETADFIIRNKIPAPKFYILTPLPGTELHREMKLKNRLLHEDYEKYTAASCVFKPVGFSPSELEQAYMELYRKVYTVKSIFLRTIFNRGVLQHPMVYLFAFFANLVYRKSIRNGDAPNIL
jgi:radical SAM superfamily enzyme YgiQ (UPF0313 family)